MQSDKNKKISSGRLTKIPLYIALGIATLILIASALAMNSRSQPEINPEKSRTKLKAEDGSAMLSRLQKSAVLVPQPEPEAERQYLEITAVPMPEHEPEPEVTDPLYEDEIIDYQVSESRQRFDAARQAPTRVALNLNRGSGRSEPDSGSTQSADQSQLDGRTLQAYQGLAQNSPVLEGRFTAAPGPYCLMQGSVIPAVLITGINSELPGQVSAQVARDVRDSLSGNHIVIPKGSRLIGQYAAAARFGSERIMMGFNRLILPDGRSLNLGVMPGAGAGGYAGFEAEVDNHWGRLILSSLFLGGITAAVSLSQDQHDEYGRQNSSSVLSAALGQSLGMTLSRVIERNLSISPTLTAPPGYKFNLVITRDINFADYQQGGGYVQP